MVKMGEKNSLSSEGLKDYKVKHSIEAPKSNVSNEKSKETTFGNFSYTHSLTQDIIPVYQMFKQRDFLGLKERLQDMDYYFVGQTFNSYFEFQECLIRDTRFSMVDVLEFPKKDGNNFKDVFDVFDEDGLARVFRNEETNIEYYWSDNSNKKLGHIIKIVGLLLDENLLEASRVLAYLFDVKIEEPVEVSEIRNGVSFMIETLNSSDLKKNMPNFYKIFNRYIPEIKFLLDKISKQDYYLDVETGKYNVYSYYTLESYCLMYEKEYSGYRVSSATMFRNIASTVYAGLIHKCTEQNTPKEISDVLLISKKRNGYKYHTNVLYLPVFSKEYLITIEAKSKKMVDSNFTRESISKDAFLLDFGLLDTVKSFSQTKEFEKTLSKKTISILNQATNIINNKIAKQGYITEPNVLDRLYRNNRKTHPEYTKKTIQSELNKVKNHICIENKLMNPSLTKYLRSELNITEKEVPLNKRPKIYIILN